MCIWHLINGFYPPGDHPPNTESAIWSVKLWTNNVITNKNQKVMYLYFLGQSSTLLCAYGTSLKASSHQGTTLPIRRVVDPGGGWGEGGVVAGVGADCRVVWGGLKTRIFVEPRGVRRAKTLIRWGPTHVGWGTEMVD